jgi:O6-methylguanine-DNA--protein-cysteine methyltransferase
VCGARLHPAGDEPAGGGGDPVLAEAVAQLRAYFAGERTGFEVPVAVPPAAGGEFEQAVWAELARIPYGEQRTYGEAFRRLAAFEETARETASLVQALIQDTFAGIGAGTLRPVAASD